MADPLCLLIIGPEPRRWGSFHYLGLQSHIASGFQAKNIYNTTVWFFFQLLKCRRRVLSASASSDFRLQPLFKAGGRVNWLYHRIYIISIMNEVVSEALL